MTRDAFLGVTSSITGQVWSGPPPDRLRRAEALAQATGHPLPLCQVLAARGVAEEGVESFLNPRLRDLMPDPHSLRDMARAGERLAGAVRSKQRIAVFADYDVDGGSSAALLSDWLRACGRPSTIYVPDRIDEGYGPNVPAMQTLAQDHDLILCVDCGTLSHDAIAAVDGTDVIVLDHHLGSETLPPAYAVVNPNRQDEDGSLGNLCAAAVVFLTLVEATRQLRAQGVSGPDLMGALDLVALATVADVAPLTGVNRALVRTGLEVMARRARPGLRTLADIAGLDETPRAYHLGYVLGPRINAGGRIGQADLGARLLATTDEAEAQRIAHRLDELNTARREIETQVTQEAIAQIEARGQDGPLLWAAGEGWHPGVVGIVASRLKERFNRPSVVIGLANGIGKGSGRSIAGVDLGAAVQRLTGEGLLLKGGGHRMAAGLTASEETLASAMERLGELLTKQGAQGPLTPTLSLDGALMPSAATLPLIESLERAGPFGASAPAPRFAITDCIVHSSRRIGANHLRLSFGDGLSTRLEAIAFGAADTELGTVLQSRTRARFHLAGRLEINTWRGTSKPQLRLEDAAPV